MRKTIWALAALAVLSLSAGRASANCGMCDKEKGHKHGEKGHSHGEKGHDCGAKGHSHGKSGEKGCCGGICPAHMDGSEVKITNTDDGVTITISSKDAEKVKAIQAAAAEHFAKKEAKEMGTWVCPMACESSDKPGKCSKCGMEMKKEEKKDTRK